ncbi:ras-related c3 botulinum toxin substrate [Anaeramoeba ignava]|uniref:Ras-related c3 botulinum toxin substrate n=1 Tax=Anaeramoeba ignava TaxID=1746090 RepID=A0A9Q0RDG8_ANAIG|nr:ras-related c3 botulinum toxin substrate [Anaeramoeba ignava]
MKKYKVIFVGEETVGKTTLLMTYDKKYLPEGYIPSVYDKFSKTYKIENKEIEIEFFDTERPDYFDRKFRYNYIDTKIIVFCFAIDFDNSFENIESVWFPEIEENIPKAKRILIGTKMDLRKNKEKINKLKKKDRKLISKEEGIELAKKIKARKYFECSSFTQKGIETIFNQITLICVGKDKKQKEEKGCILN